MTYQYKPLNIQTYINSLYTDGLHKSTSLSDDTIIKIVSSVGIFRFKGYVKALRDKISLYSINDIFFLYNSDRELSLHMFRLASDIEIKIKTYLIESVYKLTSNPFCYLLKESYKSDFKFTNDSLYEWEVKKSRVKKELYPHYRDYYLNKYNWKDNATEYLLNKELLYLDQKKDINYPPFHYFIQSATFGTLINLLSRLIIREHDILKIVGRKFGVLKPEVFISYLLRVKELRNRCAHNERIFNRNYRSVKAIGKYKKIRKDIYDHRLLDVYYTLHFLIADNNTIKNSSDLETKFINENFKSKNRKMEEFILSCMRKR